MMLDGSSGDCAEYQLFRYFILDDPERVGIRSLQEMPSTFTHVHPSRLVYIVTGPVENLNLRSGTEAYVDVTYEDVLTLQQLVEYISDNAF